MSLHSTRQKIFMRRWLSTIWKLLRFFWVLMDMSLSRFDIYQGTGAANCLKNHTDSWCPYFFKKIFCLMSSLKFTMSDVTSLLLDNLSGLIKFIFRPEAVTWVYRKWTDADGVHHWRIFRSGYRKLVWAGFEPKTTEFRSDAKVDW